MKNIFKDAGDIHSTLKKMEMQSERLSFSDQDVERVKYFFTGNEKSHIREAVNVVGLSFGTIRTILRIVI